MYFNILLLAVIHYQFAILILATSITQPNINLNPLPQIGYIEAGNSPIQSDSFTRPSVIPSSSLSDSIAIKPSNIISMQGTDKSKSAVVNNTLAPRGSTHDTKKKREVEIKRWCMEGLSESRKLEMKEAVQKGEEIICVRIKVGHKGKKELLERIKAIEKQKRETDEQWRKFWCHGEL